MTYITSTGTYDFIKWNNKFDITILIKNIKTLIG